MLIIVTSISGSARKDYLREFEKYAKKHQKRVKIYYVGEMLFEQAKKIGISITPENVLNSNPHVLNSLRSAVFENILLTLPKNQKENEVVIISFHAFFFWKKIFTRAYDRFYLGQLNAELFVNFLDDAVDIKSRLSKREQWKSENLSVEDILLWQNVEVEITSSWAEMHMKPFYAIPIKQPVSSLFRLVFHPEYEPVYISMPITHLRSRKDQKKVDDFVKKLNEYFVVFDPRLVTGTSAAVNLKKKEGEILYNQIVNRDLYYLVKQSKKIIAFFPKIVSSPGVINELREAHETNKNVWIIHPGKRGSPFLTYFSDKVFSTEKEFFKFLNKHIKQHRKH